jgi:methionyl-tRNA formyltransferase
MSDLTDIGKTSRLMRTVYLGTSDFAATVLDRLAASPHRPQLVVTRPDAPRGRGRRVAAPPVADTARLLGIEVFQPEDLNAEESRTRIAEAAPDAVVICAYGALIREPLLSEHLHLNVHPSLLPRWRGAAPIERAIEAGDEETGVTIMRPTAEFDAGPIAAQRAEVIRSDDDHGSLAARLAALGGELLVEVLELEPAFREQPDTGVTYAEKIGPEDRRLDPALTADLLERRVRALRPHIGAYIELPWDERLGVTRAALAAGHGPAPGELTANDGRLLFGAAAGALELCEVHPAGKRPMDAGAWIRGYGGRLRE